MSTYEFQISITPDNYQAQSPLLGHHISHQGAQNAIAGPAPIETPTPEPTIIHYNANKQKPAPYGSGEDGFELSFNTWEAFSAWKTAEETKNCVDYYKVDSHTSKAIPPRFKEHTKLACSRHTRAGQKKYVRKHPERQRKTPSKKIEIGCPSIICYKTYVDSPIVKVNYVSQHSHEIGEANLPFTKKYRKEMTRKGASHGGTKQSSNHALLGTGHEDTFMDEHQGDGDSTTSPEQSQFSHYQHHTAEPSLPPSPPASAMEDPMEIHQMERQQHAAYGASIARVPAPPYEPYDPHNLPSQNTSPSISHAPQQLQQPPQHHIHQNRQHPQQIPLTRQDQPPPPPPSQPFARSREASTVSMNREIHTTGHLASQYHPYHRQVEQHQHQQHQHQPPQHQVPQHQPSQHQQPQHQPHQASQPHPQPQPYSHPQQSYHQPIPTTHHSLTSTTSIQSHPPSTGPSPLPDRRTLLQERWTRLETMFAHVRRQANEFEFSDVSLSALEMLVLRLYLELPSNTQASPMHGAINQHPPQAGRDQNHGMLPQ